MKNSERGTTYRSVRHRGGEAIEAEHAAPERAVEASLSRAKGAIASENLPVDEHRATAFRPSPEREAGDRIGADHDVGRGQPIPNTHAAEAKSADAPRGVTKGK
jgi:hypothetical protein